MRFYITNWEIQAPRFGQTIDEIKKEFGEPEYISREEDNTVLLYYGVFNLNFRDEIHLSSIGFGEGADLWIDGINPFLEPEAFKEMLKCYKKRDYYGQMVYIDIGLSMDGFNEEDDGVPKTILFSTIDDLEKSVEGL